MKFFVVAFLLILCLVSANTFVAAGAQHAKTWTDRIEAVEQ